MSISYRLPASMGLLAIPIFIPAIPLMLRTLAGFLFTLAGGLVPGTLFATVPRIVANVTQFGLVNGLILQATGAGQFAPLVQTFMVDSGGPVICSFICNCVCPHRFGFFKPLKSHNETVV